MGLREKSFRLPMCKKSGTLLGSPKPLVWGIVELVSVSTIEWDEKNWTRSTCDRLRAWNVIKNSSFEDFGTLNNYFVFRSQILMRLVASEGRRRNYSMLIDLKMWWRWTKDGFMSKCEHKWLTCFNFNLSSKFEGELKRKIHFGEEITIENFMNRRYHLTKSTVGSSFSDCNTISSV